MKTKEELNILKQEYETVNTKLKELTEDELAFVTGGLASPFVVDDNETIYNPHLYPERDPEFKPGF